MTCQIPQRRLNQGLPRPLTNNRPKKANLTKEDSSQPFVDKPGDASRERSRSPARADSNSGAKASSPPAPVIGTVDKQSPPADVDDALLQGWSEEDYGGNGDCVFRAIKAHIALESGQPKLDEAQAKSQGALLRAEALQHIRKHADRFENYWAPPAKALTQDPPPTFQGWLKKAGKQSTYYANGVFLQALAERLDSILIIWRKTANSWERYTVAGRFGSNGIACKSTEGHIINLCLKNEHYTLLRKPAEGTVPEAWLREPVSTIVDLTGGGGGGDSREVSGFSSSPFSAQSLSRLSLPPSPSLHTLPACSDLADSDLCRDPVTPSVHSRASVDPRPGLKHPPPTPSVHTLRRVRGKSSVHFPASVVRPVRPLVRRSVFVLVRSFHPLLLCTPCLRAQIQTSTRRSARVPLETPSVPPLPLSWVGKPLTLGLGKIIRPVQGGSLAKPAPGTERQLENCGGLAISRIVDSKFTKSPN